MKFSVGAGGGARDIDNLPSPNKNSSFWEHPPFDTFWMLGHGFSREQSHQEEHLGRLPTHTDVAGELGLLPGAFFLGKV